MSQAITPFLTDITHFHRDTPDGEYDLTFYPILPGVILAAERNSHHRGAVGPRGAV